MISLKTVVQSIRAPFLILTLACVLLGTGVAVVNQADINMTMLLLALLGALLAHISVNTLNEYHDYKTGLDLATTRTPFSGGSGALPGNPAMLNTVIIIGISSLIATLMIGIFFIWKYGMAILPTGLAGLILIITYTGWITRHPFLCLIAPGIGFGFLMVSGTQFVLQGEYAPLSWLVATIPFFLVNNLLLLNQYPDIRADTEAGRFHFPIAYGIKRSNTVYGMSVVAVIAIIVISVLSGHLPKISLIALTPMPLAFFSLYGAISHGDNLGAFPKYLSSNIAAAIMTTALLGLSLFIS